ncbi:hypothetical protein [Clostridium sp. KNHs205]|jgi:hypothetical protein|uniref:hypothetical protein n=1 Tax=Clostridium sp. KNHs205 TaxID=1449050 RepID=UPI00051BCE17|nr:hypothetical protein [Clostridium sp. KNHs205]
MNKKKLFALCLGLVVAFQGNIYANAASTVDQQPAYTEDTDTEIVYTGTLYDVQDSTTSSGSNLRAGIDWDTVIYVCVNGWDISRQDWWNPFDDNVDEWAKFKVGVRLTSEDGISVKLNTSGHIYKNNSFWSSIASTTAYGDEVEASRTDQSPNHGDDYETTGYHKMWDDLGVNRLNETTIVDFTF